MSAPPRRTSRRLTGLDQARAVAILAMLAAHFAPGLFAQVPAPEALRVPVLAFARLATPTFVVVFGVTVGFVYLPRYRRLGPGPTAAGLARRAGLLSLCAVIIALPPWGRLVVTGETDPGAWLSGLYSVLLFYVLALAVLPAWLRWLSAALVGRVGSPSHKPLALKCLVAGAALWVLGTAGHRLWPQGPPGGPEFVRTLLVSGSFGYLQLMGTALLAVPVGVWLRDRWEAGTDRPALGRILAAGLATAAIGGLWGWAAGEYDPAGFLSGDLRTPPRAWYFLHVGGVGLALVPALELLTRSTTAVRPAAYGLALFGQAGLVIYTGHVFVLPGLALTDRVLPLHGAARVAAALGPFAAFCALVMYLRHRRTRPEGPGRYGPGPSEAATSAPASTGSAYAHSPPSW